MRGRQGASARSAAISSAAPPRAALLAASIAALRMSLNPVLEDELNPLPERPDAVPNGASAVAMQRPDQVRDLILLNSHAQLRQRKLVRDALQQQRAERRVIAPHQWYSARGLPAPKRRGLRRPEIRIRRELEDSRAAVGTSATDDE